MKIYHGITILKRLRYKISRVTGILYRLKSVFPKEVLVTLYKTLIVIPYNTLWPTVGMDCNRIGLKKSHTIDY